MAVKTGTAKPNPQRGDTLNRVGGKVFDYVKKGAGSDNSMAGSAVSGALSTSAGAVKTFQLSQITTDVLIRTGKATVLAGDAVKSAYLAGKCAITAVQYAQNHFVPYTSRLTQNVFLRSANEVGLLKTRTVKAITGEKPLPNLLGKPKVGQALHKSVVYTSNILSQSGDYMLQGIGKSGNAIATAHTGIKTAAKATGYTGKAVYTTARGTFRAGKSLIKTSVKSYRYISANGWKNFFGKAWQTVKGKVGGALAAAGNSFISAIANMLKGAAKKFVLPLLLLIAVAAAVIVVVSAPVASVGSMLGGIFNLVGDNGSKTEYTVDDFLNDANNGVPKLRADAVAGISDALSQTLKVNGGGYDYTRVKITSSGEPVQGTYANVDTKFYPTGVVVEMMKPVFNAIVVAKNGMELREADGRALTQEIFEAMYGVSYVAETEYCGQAAENGEGDPIAVHTECGERHALANCPNVKTGTHTTFTCSGCDLSACSGHKGVVNCGHTSDAHTEWQSMENPGCYTTVQHSGADAATCGKPLTGAQCSGYSYCGGHSVYTAVLNMNGLEDLTDKYFVQPIATLEAIPDRTPEQEAELSNLRFGYEICNALMSGAPVYYGGEGFMTPVRFTDIASPFGWRYHPIYGDWRHHNGLDMSAASGTPIYASKAGTVIGASYNASMGYYVKIKHDEEYTTVYMHMTYYIVESGDQVAQGQVIGYVGSTGDSTGPHLHFQIEQNGDCVDPALYIDLNWMPGDEPKTGEATNPTATQPQETTPPTQ